MQRVETYPVPEVALREAVLNAIGHKDYASAIPIQISVYDNKIMMWNPGQLPPDWTVTQLTEKHSSQPFNPDVANAFFRAGMIESWGRGIERVVNACLQAGVPAPEWRHEQTGLWVVFHQRAGIRVVTPVETPVETRVKGRSKASGASGTTQKTTQKILDFLKAHPSASRREIAAHLTGISEDGVKYNLSLLKASGRIQRIGAAKGGHWQILEGPNE